MREILVIGLFGHFEKCGFKVFLRSLRAQIDPVGGKGVKGKVNVSLKIK